MLKNVIKGFEEMMNCVLTAMNESLSDPYAGWNEGRTPHAERGSVWYPLMDILTGKRVWKHALFSLTFRCRRENAASFMEGDSSVGRALLDCRGRGSESHSLSFSILE